MTTRVREVVLPRHEEQGTPRWGWLFPSPEGEDQVSYDTINCQHDRVMIRLSNFRPWRLYDMRPTYLTRLGESGADAFTIQALAGHANIVTSQEYMHPTPERVETAIVQLEKYNDRKAENAT